MKVREEKKSIVHFFSPSKMTHHNKQRSMTDSSKSCPGDTDLTALVVMHNALFVCTSKSTSFQANALKWTSSSETLFSQIGPKWEKEM
jgi:hypothetical protein